MVQCKLLKALRPGPKESPSAWPKMASKKGQLFGFARVPFSGAKLTLEGSKVAAVVGTQRAAQGGRLHIRMRPRLLRCPGAEPHCSHSAEEAAGQAEAGEGRRFELDASGPGRVDLACAGSFVHRQSAI